MPIKFRCQQCRQFLGISRSKAGNVVDCPTCGRTIRVPDLDGTIRPLPKPGLDMQDSSLAKALNEIAAIGGEPVGADDDDAEQFDSAAVSDSDDMEQFESAPPEDDVTERKAPPAAGPEVVELDPLPPPEPIELAPAAAQRRELPPSADFDDDSGAERGWKSTRQGGDSWKRLLAAAEPEGESSAARVQSAAAEPVLPPATAQPAPLPSPAEQPASVTHTGPAVVRFAASTWFAMAGIAAVVFAAGFWAGRITALQPERSGDPTTTQSVPDSDSQPPAAAASDDRTPAIRGRITWRTESGEVRPDVGARIIVLPVERDGSSLIPSAGLQRDSGEVDRELTHTMIRQLGGDFQTTDDSGQFSIELPNAGRFHLIVLSNALPRDDGADITDVESVVSRYFDRPPVVLGRVQLYLDEVQYSGTGTTPWDYSFQRS